MIELTGLLNEQNLNTRPYDWVRGRGDLSEVDNARLADENEQKVVAATKLYLQEHPVLFSTEITDSINSINSRLRTDSLEIASKYVDNLLANGLAVPLSAKRIANRALINDEEIGYMLLKKALEETIQAMDKKNHRIFTEPAFPTAQKYLVFKNGKCVSKFRINNFVYHKNHDDMINWFIQELEKRGSQIRCPRPDRQYKRTN